MSLFPWIKDQPPDAWTPDRERRAMLIAQFHGDIAMARRVWEDKTRGGFARYLLRAGHIGRGDQEAEQ